MGPRDKKVDKDWDSLLCIWVFEFNARYFYSARTLSIYLLILMGRSRQMSSPTVGRRNASETFRLTPSFQILLRVTVKSLSLSKSIVCIIFVNWLNCSWFWDHNPYSWRGEGNTVLMIIDQVSLIFSLNTLLTNSVTYQISK